MVETFSKFVSHIVTAMSQCSLYSNEHPAVIELTDKATTLMDELYVDDTLSITLLRGNIILNDVPIIEKGAHTEKFRQRLKAKGIDKIIIKRGISAEELVGFITLLASKDEAPVSSDHILVGTVQVKLKALGDDATAIMGAGISRIRGVYQEVSRFKRLDIVGLEDAVLGFISALKREANVLRIVSPVKSHSEYTYVHAANVAVLTLFQAESLGLKGENLHEAGLSGLLHDVGKMFVSRDVIEKKSGLDEAEWKEMRRHPIYGAIYLSSLDNIPKLAVIAAYEHHLKYDGSGYPDTRWRPRKQHVISQIVAISDCFDAVRTERSYRKALGVGVLISILKESAGKDFNPLLVDNFTLGLKRIGAI